MVSVGRPVDGVACVIAAPLTRTSSDDVPIRDRLSQVEASVGCGQYYGGQCDISNSGSPDPHIGNDVPIRDRLLQHRLRVANTIGES